MMHSANASKRSFGRHVRQAPELLFQHHPAKARPKR